MRGKVRIIGGKWRRRLLPVADAPGLRPTPDRVRETLFNWLADELEGARCLDLFAGSGALGFEAASRGATRVVLVERSAAVARHLQEQARALDDGDGELQVVCADATIWLRQSKEAFDVVFVDPPYGSQDLLTLLETLDSGGHVARHGCVFVESPAGVEESVVPGHWQVRREQRAGRVGYYLAAPRGGGE